MDIGIISDIHGDYAALATALERLDNFHHINQILCAGDLVGRGPHPDGVVQVIRERNIPTVRGNHDEWSYGLSSENKGYLKSLPLEWRGNFENCTVFMCHGKPGNNLWGLYRDHISNTLLNMMLASLGVDVLITGTPICRSTRVQQGCASIPVPVYVQ
jgi:predicted phosphodiesterase